MQKHSYSINHWGKLEDLFHIMQSMLFRPYIDLTDNQIYEIAQKKNGSVCTTPYNGMLVVIDDHHTILCTGNIRNEQVHVLMLCIVT